MEIVDFLFVAFCITSADGRFSSLPGCNRDSEKDSPNHRAWRPPASEVHGKPETGIDISGESFRFEKLS